MSLHRHALRAAAAFLAALACCAGPAVHAANGFGEAPEPLFVEEAFVPRVARVDREAVAIEWDIADGYYLYRDKTRVDAGGGLADVVTLGEPAFSDARIVNDEFFGDSAVWRDTAAVTLPVTAAPTAGARGTLEVRFQGCADLGLCYPPTTVSLDAVVPAAALAVAPTPRSSASAGTPPSGVPSSGVPSSGIPSSGVPSSGYAPAGAGSSPTEASSGLAALFGGSDAAPFGAEPELLTPEEAFVPLLTRTAADTLEVRWEIRPGYYLYEHRFGAEVVGADGRPVVDVTGVSVPDGVERTDEFFGRVTTFHDAALATFELGPGLAPGDTATLRAAYQGCAEIGVCFPPSSIDLPFVATAAASPAVSTAAPIAAVDTAGPVVGRAGSAPPAVVTATAAPPAPRADLVSEQGRLSTMLASSSLWLSVATFFGLGLLLAFTPCVLPMVPILSSLIVGRGDDAGRMGTGRAFRLSLVYVLVMATTYAVLGTLVALSGANVQVWLQQPWVLGAFAALFVVLALAMFGVFELEVPRALQSRLNDASNRQTGGSYRGVVAMALLSTLVVGPCVTAPLAGALIYIADTGDAVVGATALFALGLGMGTPLLLIGTSAGSLLPRAGMWMVRVRQGFGVLMLGLAIWMLSRFVSETATVGLAGLLALGTGIWLGAADRIEAASGGRARVAKAAGLAASLYGTALLVGALGGGDSLVRPLALYGGGGTGESGVEEPELAFRRVADLAELERVVASSASEGRTVMLDFYADWCISCKEMEAYTFGDERVMSLLDGVTLVQVDVTENDADDRALLDRFDLIAPPTIVFFDPTGRELDGARVVGFMNAERFGAHVERVLAATLASR